MESRWGRGRGRGSGRGLTSVGSPEWPPHYLPPQGMTSRTSSLPGECWSYAQDCIRVTVSLTHLLTYSRCSGSRLTLPSRYVLPPLTFASQSPLHLLSPPSHSALTFPIRHSLSPATFTFTCHTPLPSSPLSYHLRVSLPSPPVSPVPLATLSLRRQATPGLGLTPDKDQVQPSATGRSAGPWALRGWRKG